jgi:hypothetical protein
MAGKANMTNTEQWMLDDTNILVKTLKSAQICMTF